LWVRNVEKMSNWCGFRSKADASYKKFGKHSDSEDETELFTLKKPSPEEGKSEHREGRRRRGHPTVARHSLLLYCKRPPTVCCFYVRVDLQIEDLKRLNNIHKENEIFAKRTIRVPHHPITLALAGVHVSGRSSPNDPTTSTQVDTSKLTTSLQETEVNQIIFQQQYSPKEPRRRAGRGFPGRQRRRNSSAAPGPAGADGRRYVERGRR
jgi:hypothetical protein